MTQPLGELISRRKRMGKHLLRNKHLKAFFSDILGLEVLLVLGEVPPNIVDSVEDRAVVEYHRNKSKKRLDNNLSISFSSLPRSVPIKASKDVDSGIKEKPAHIY